MRAVVHDLLKNGSRSVKLQTISMLWDRIYGKPKQDVSLSGSLQTVPRNPILASLPKEALEEMARAWDGLVAKHGLPEALQDSSQNQPESKPALERLSSPNGPEIVLEPASANLEGNNP